MDETNATALPEHHMGVVPFPPIKTLFQDSWHLFTEKALKMLLLYIYSFLASIAVFVVFGALVASTILPKILANTSNPEKMVSELLSPDVLGTGGFILVLLIIASGAVSLAVTAALPLILNDKEDQSAWTHFMKGFKYVIPLFITSFLAGLLVFGGFFLFVIPAVIIALFIMFSTYVVVLENISWVQAIKMSVGIIAQNFGKIIGRILLFFIIYVLLFGLLPALVPDDSSAEITVGIVVMIASWVFSWYSASYIFTIYKQARAAYDSKKSTSMTWIWVVSGIGWLIAIIVGSFAFTAIANNGDSIMKALKNYDQKSTRAYKEKSMKGTAGSGFINDSVVMSEVNVARVNADLMPLEYDQPLCAYATRRLKQMKDLGGFDDYGGFIEDASTKEIWNSYFNNYSVTNTFTSSIAESDEAVIAARWAANDDPNKSILFPDFTHGCVRSDETFAVIVVAKHK